MRPRPLLLIATLFLSACAAPLNVDIEKNNRAIILSATELKPDFESGFSRARARQTFFVFLNLERVTGGSARKNEKIWPNLQADLVWRARAVEPGTYELRSITELRSSFSGELFKSTTFNEPQNRFAVEAGEVVYIGKFVVNLKTSPQLVGRHANEATKSYSLDTDEARRVLTEHFGVDKFALKTFNPFETDPSMRTKYETPYEGRPRKF